MSTIKRGKYPDWLTEDGLIKLEGWARDGLTDEQIAHNVGIARGTLYSWKKEYPDIDEALKRGKEVIDMEVENALLRRALGFEYEELKDIQEVDGHGNVRSRQEKTTRAALPDTTAQIFWLKNRKPKEWRDKTQMEVTGGLDITERGKVFQKHLKKDD